MASLHPEHHVALHALDSLAANEFQVLVDGVLVSGVFSVKGLTPLSITPVKAWLGLIPLPLPGALNYRPVTITKMVQRDTTLPINRWIRDTLANPTGKITREVTVVAMDEGRETRRWVLYKAWISEISYSDFDSGSDQLVEERLTLQYQSIKMLWPGE